MAGFFVLRNSGTELAPRSCLLFQMRRLCVSAQAHFEPPLLSHAFDSFSSSDLFMPSTATEETGPRQRHSTGERRRMKTYAHDRIVKSFE